MRKRALQFMIGTDCPMCGGKRLRRCGSARESLVTVLLKPDGDGTLLTLTHEQFFDEGARDRHQSGWTEGLDKLAALFA